MKVGEKARQGDIQIKKVERMPANLKLKKDNVIVSASNNHELEKGKVYEENDGLIVAYLEVSSKTQVVHKDNDGNHADHDPIPLTKGIYEVKRQKEYLPDGYNLVQD